MLNQILIQTLFVLATYLARNVFLISVKVIKMTCYVYTYVQAVMIGTIYPLIFVSQGTILRSVILKVNWLASWIWQIKNTPSVLFFSSCWSNPLLPDLGKQDSHYFECHLVSWLPQVLLLHCVPLHPKWLHQCHPTCWQWHLPHSDLPPTRHHLQDWGGGCEEGRQSRWTEGKGHGELHYWEWGLRISVRHFFIYICRQWLMNRFVDYTICTCTNRHKCCTFWNYPSNNSTLSTPTTTICLFRDSWWANPTYVYVWKCMYVSAVVKLRMLLSTPFATVGGNSFITEYSLIENCVAQLCVRTCTNYHWQVSLALGGDMWLAIIIVNAIEHQFVYRLYNCSIRSAKLSVNLIVTL